MLVGSIPLDTVQEVFETFGKPLGKYLFARNYFTFNNFTAMYKKPRKWRLNIFDGYLTTGRGNNFAPVCNLTTALSIKRCPI